MLSVAVFTVESGDRALMPASVIKSRHMVKDCPQSRGQAGVMLSLGLTHRVQQQSSLLRNQVLCPVPDVVTGMLQVFPTSVYALLDNGLRFSLLLLFFLSLLKCSEVLHDPIVVSTPSRENVRTNKLYKDFPIVVCGKTMCADFVE